MAEGSHCQADEIYIVYYMLPYVSFLFLLDVPIYSFLTFQTLAEETCCFWLCPELLQLILLRLEPPRPERPQSEKLAQQLQLVQPGRLGRQWQQPQ